MVTNTDITNIQNSCNRIEKGLNTLLEHFGLEQTGKNTVPVDDSDNAS